MSYYFWSKIPLRRATAGSSLVAGARYEVQRRKRGREMARARLLPR
jgi:hypothetical protein